jgi:hypothetical protein
VISFLLSTLPAPLDWLSWGLLTGPAGLVLIGVGIWGLKGLSRGEADPEFYRPVHDRDVVSGG